MYKKWLSGLLLSLAIIIFFNFVSAEPHSIYLGEPAFGARALAIGGLAAGSGDISSVYWNPADTVNVDGFGLLLGRDNKFNIGDWYEDQVGLVFPKMGRLAIGGFYIKDSTSLNSERGSQLINNPWATKLSGLSIGVRLTPVFSLGTSLMQLSFNGTIDEFEEKSQAVLSNLAIAVRRGSWRFGVVAHNLTLSGDLKVEQDYHIGVAWENNETRIQVEMISYIPPGLDAREWSLGGGVEFVFRPGLSFRLGRSQMRLDEPGYLTAGLRTIIGPWIFDYSYAPHSIGATHYLSTGLQF